MTSLLDDILKNVKGNDNNYYTILGCDELSTDEQLQCEYRVKALELHPDKNFGNPVAAQRFQELQEAKAVLLDPEMRRKYDKWRKSGLTMSFQKYLSMNVTSLHWVSRKSKEPMLTASESTGMDDIQEYKLPENVTSYWKQEEPPNDLLRKFRNYEI
ncbi:J domain-containing protein-like [Ornithodoros turicata]|uniref:J domain-containing protein-like n=1 Tax=Ornithodoros turicata TaxID=34597 RepID=UPI003139896F